MNHKSPMYLYNIRRHAERLVATTSGKTLADYKDGGDIRDVVEVHIGCLGANLARLAEVDLATAERLPGRQSIVALGTHLSRDYDCVDHGRVWHVATNLIPILTREVSPMLDTASAIIGETGWDTRYDIIPQIGEQAEEIKRICHHHGVRRLDLFGSATRSRQFNPETSDIDFIVTFQSWAKKPWAGEYTDLQQALSDLFGRPVDLISAGANGFSNPYFRAAVDATRVLLYEA